MKGMILAAGKGTRVRPITQQIPKPMIPILGKPVMESMIELFAQHNITKIVINTSYLSEVIEGYFGDGHHFDVQLSYSCEGELKDGKFESQALGSAGGMKKSKSSRAFLMRLLLLSAAMPGLILTSKRRCVSTKKMVVLRPL
ncbi:mannose-1-phosphate guanylyltransferase [Vibrio variabilis]|uniref:Mannose-1-phosphate guanylyltransferase n=1 Tax=Vibrio variabilis TaxID=990271 RepID=A0ABQ0JLN3_9VIBR|nr:mannose-1-phosphate guanylyltransferase [Vibrio variabilis]